NAAKEAQIPAAVHVDQTARPQSVSKSTNPEYWELINDFYKQTGVPVVLNTSFNLKGEPIVCSPFDAIRTFYTSGLDTLAIGDFLVQKDGA
ncbi:MAG TPA: carbamoyltransferase C-terminal domain-containing protein, partial [Oligoflexia bacterium]|nr:carbamoyltransferase C-terminal domain-containing protein [Oligoflexia bacterium]